MNTNIKIIVGFLVGAAIGTATGLLMAPSTGKTTRKNLNKKARKLVRQIEEVVGREKRKRATQGGAHIKNGKAPVTAR